MNLFTFATFFLLLNTCYGAPILALTSNLNPVTRNSRVTSPVRASVRPNMSPSKMTRKQVDSRKSALRTSYSTTTFIETKKPGIHDLQVRKDPRFKISEYPTRRDIQEFADLIDYEELNDETSVGPDPEAPLFDPLAYNDMQTGYFRGYFHALDIMFPSVHIREPGVFRLLSNPDVNPNVVSYLQHEAYWNEDAQVACDVLDVLMRADGLEKIDGISRSELLAPSRHYIAVVAVDRETDEGEHYPVKYFRLNRANPAAGDTRPFWSNKRGLSIPKRINMPQLTNWRHVSGYLTGLAPGQSKFCGFYVVKAAYLSNQMPMKDKMRTFTMEEVAKHNTKEDCWCVIHGKVYDFTKFLPEHPGGERVILRVAGRDGTAAFDPIHPNDIIARLAPETHIGNVDPASLKEFNEKQESPAVQEDKKAAQTGKPSINAMINLNDFEAVARSVLKPEAWAYYSSGSDDEITLRENHAAFHRIFLRPRVMVDVKNIDTSTSLLGIKTSLPVYISACALGKLGHPEGEVVLTKGAGTRNVIQMIPTLASCSLSEMTSARIPGQTQWFQLYVNPDRKVTRSLVEAAEAKGCKALVITVDAPALGRREKDMRMKFVDDIDLKLDSKVNRSQGASRALSSFIDPALSWKDIAWFQSITSLPIIIKGIQCGEDAVMAVRHGAKGIIVSNHGGRQLDTTRSGIEILPEVIETLRKAGLRRKVEVYVDGGFRRGSDIYKALALGADAVGLGRPPIYAMAAYGVPGVEKCLDLVREELEMTMRLMGTPTIQDIHTSRNLLCTASLNVHAGNPAKDFLSDEVYDPVRLAMKPKL